MIHRCPVCLGVMRPLFTGFFCPNDCDLEAKRPVFLQSQLWVVTSPGCRQLSCPHCLSDDKTVEPLICGPERDGYFGATCKFDSSHKIRVQNDEGR